MINMRFLSLGMILIVLLQYNSSAKANKTDTIIVDLEFEKPDFYVYHFIEEKVPKFLDNWNYLFNEQDKSKILLKRIGSKKPFTGVLIIKDNERRAKYTCPYVNGIPNGIWKKHTHDWYKICTEFSLLEYTIPIRMGFPHGEGKRWSYQSDCNPKLIGVVNYDNGIPTGYYKRINGDQIIEGNLFFKYRQQHKTAIFKYDSSTHYGKLVLPVWMRKIYFMSIILKI